ncbi:MJ1255/VC2487 family glycosyltransferase [Teredinibacter sp. KSP-S5-2]|uniref:MJ1255/VC2487 family glycosyltransferase n=1 Tax=Teredinibacter sp. KSP-S5-2 TaxID=3034506 RepID=UPI0029352C87|nr:MJ1255/VC2487 family glycosyltransferase [Teredinibacter sp. KSP-S5-2]WNO10935.1 glycosyltransferase family protein [Teredinibacter sp. KSP-S5-2]
MKVLYGVQATGNGHISRARALNKYLKEFGVDVDYVFSGRPREQFFDMEEFGNWKCYRGLTFVHEAGDLKIFRTLQHNNMLQLIKDIREFQLDGYDLIISDFEPITSWACKTRGIPCIGVSHQQAFAFDVPRRGGGIIPKLIMKYFAPTTSGLGLHWHHFNQPILPPIAEIHETDEASDPNKIVVYLGFEEPEDVIQLLEPFDDHLFIYYGPFPQYESRGHIQLKPLSREGFKQDLATCSGVICNAGFELSSEAIQLGKKLLVKPLKGQLEQLSNAKALEATGLGMTMGNLDSGAVKDWLENWQAKQVIYPNVAKAIAEWIAKGRWQDESSRDELVNRLWSETNAAGVPSFESAPLPNLLQRS